MHGSLQTSLGVVRMRQFCCRVKAVNIGFIGGESNKIAHEMYSSRVQPTTSCNFYFTCCTFYA